MSKIALGAVQFGMDYGINSISGQVLPAEIKDILNYAYRQNIDLLDTAPAYGNSEQVLGKCNSHEFKIVTKTRHFDCLEIGNREAQLLENDFSQSLIDLKKDDEVIAFIKANELSILKVL